MPGPTIASLSLRRPRATSRMASSGSGRCGSRAISAGASRHVRHAFGLVGSTGIAFGCTGPTTPFASVVMKAPNAV